MTDIKKIKTDYFNFLSSLLRIIEDAPLLYDSMIV